MSDETFGARVEWVQLSGLKHRLLHWPGQPSAPAMLMLHGWLDQASSLGELASLLDRDQERLALDFRGHGHSEWIGAGGYYHFFDYLRDLAELLQDPRLARTPIWLLGHSMGGAVATLLAGALPEQIKGLILLEGTGPVAQPASASLTKSRRWLADLRRYAKGPRHYPSVPEMQARLATMYPEFEPELLQRFVQAAVIQDGDKGWRWRYDPMHRCSNPSPFQQEIYTSFAGAYTGPVLQIYGEQSPLARRENPQVQAREAAFTGPRKVVQIPKARHMMHLTHAPDCARAIAEWMQEHA